MDFTQWYSQVPGNCLLQFEQEQVKKWMPLVRGSTVLQLGGLPNQFDLAKESASHYYFLAPQATSGSEQPVNIQAAYDELPLQADSVNLVLLVHVLEMVDHPTVVLKEIFDVLAPNGKLLLFCLNSWSVWGLQKWLSSPSTGFKEAKFYSPACLQNWLASLGFSNLKDKTLGFRSMHNHRPVSRWTFLVEALGQITVPMMGAVNVFLVEKRVYAGLASLRYHWQRRPAPLNVAAEPSVRVKIG